ncbi:class I SAM-dependent methyltransferase, partial [bacterium]
MSKALLNNTEHFYRGDSPSLLWEMTVCQSLADPAGSYAKTLERPEPYGAKVARLLGERFGLSAGLSVMEVGGGYGTLMKEFAKALSPSSITMLDISPRFLDMQREALKDLGGISFINADVLQWLAGCEKEFDLLISNENIGDFEAVDGLDAKSLLERIQKGSPFTGEPLD